MSSCVKSTMVTLAASSGLQSVKLRVQCALLGGARRSWVHLREAKRMESTVELFAQ